MTRVGGGDDPFEDTVLAYVCRGVENQEKPLLG
jgi:hypothetical protein